MHYTGKKLTSIWAQDLIIIGKYNPDLKSRSKQSYKSYKLNDYEVK